MAEEATKLGPASAGFPAGDEELVWSVGKVGLNGRIVGFILGDVALFVPLRHCIAIDKPALNGWPAALGMFADRVVPGFAIFAHSQYELAVRIDCIEPWIKTGPRIVVKAVVLVNIGGEVVVIANHDLAQQLGRVGGMTIAKLGEAEAKGGGACFHHADTEDFHEDVVRNA